MACLGDFVLLLSATKRPQFQGVVGIVCHNEGRRLFVNSPRGVFTALPKNLKVVCRPSSIPVCIICERDAFFNREDQADWDFVGDDMCCPICLEHLYECESCYYIEDQADWLNTELEKSQATP